MFGDFSLSSFASYCGHGSPGGCLMFGGYFAVFAITGGIIGFGKLLHLAYTQLLAELAGSIIHGALIYAAALEQILIGKAHFHSVVGHILILFGNSGELLYEVLDAIAALFQQALKVKQAFYAVFICLDLTNLEQLLHQFMKWKDRLVCLSQRLVF